MKNLKKGTISDKLKKEIGGFLFDLKSDSDKQVDSQRSRPTNHKHVMISYNWDVQDVMIKVRSQRDIFSYIHVGSDLPNTLLVRLSFNIA